MEEVDYRGYRFQAEIDQDPTLQCVVACRCHRWDSTSLDIELTLLGDESARRKTASYISGLPTNQLQLTPVSSTLHPAIKLFGITGMSADLDKVLVRAGAAEIGIATQPSSQESTYLVFARLQPSGILSSGGSIEHHYKHGISNKRFSDGAIEFHTTVGKFDADETFEFRTTESHGNRVNEQIQRATLTGKVVVPMGQSLEDTHERLVREIDDACLALSFCYRQPVSYYEVEYLPMPYSGRHALLRVKAPSGRKRLSGEEFIDARNLEGGGLQRLISAIQSATDAAGVGRAIKFLSASFEEDLEVAYFMAFSAMETVVDACLINTERSLMTAAKWRRFEASLGNAVQSCGEIAGIHQDVIDEMTAKLAELKRASLQARIASACGRYSPQIDDLWPKAGFAEGMRQAAKARNLLFHSASASSLPLQSSLVRIQVFTERLLAGLLGWPTDSFWSWNDQRLKWANASQVD